MEGCPVNVLRRMRCLLPAVLMLLAALPAPAPVSAQAAKRSRPTAAVTNAACLAKAMGGMESIARFSTIYTRYEVEIAGVKGTDIFVRDVRGAFRRGLDVPGVVSELTVFDGAKGWRRGTDGVVQPLSGVPLANAVTEAYLGTFMHVVPGRIPGTVERVGLDRATGLVKLRVSPQGGTPVTLFLDTLTCLPARMEQGAGAGREAVFLRDWRTVSGIKLAHSIRRSQGDTARDARITLLEARFDAPLPAGVFAKPAAVAPKQAEAPMAEASKPAETPKPAEASK